MSANITLKIGREYTVYNQRKGKFCLRVTNVSDPWITGIITKGKAGAILKHNERKSGEEVTLRDSLTTFSELPKSSAQKEPA